jgi:hypothetical protein
VTAKRHNVAPASPAITLKRALCIGNLESEKFASFSRIGAFTTADELERAYDLAGADYWEIRATRTFGA